MKGYKSVFYEKIIMHNYRQRSMSTQYPGTSPQVIEGLFILHQLLTLGNVLIPNKNFHVYLP